MPASTGIAPASRSAPKIVYAFESRTWPNSGVSVGGISSSPVESTTTRGRGWTSGVREPRVREQAQLGRTEPLAALGRARCPRRRPRRAAERAAPRSRPRTGARLRPCVSAFSIGTMVSAPAGIGAPVAIRTASPPPTVARAGGRSGRGPRSSARRVAPAWRRRRRRHARRTRPSPRTGTRAGSRSATTSWPTTHP